MKKHLIFLLIISVMILSCGTFSIEKSKYNIVKAEIINENTIHIYFSGQPQEINFIYDIKIIVNNDHKFLIKQSEHNIFQDMIDGLIRYRCKTDKYFSEGDKVEVIDFGSYIKGKVIIYYKK